jgi:hypothetical protein
MISKKATVKWLFYLLLPLQLIGVVFSQAKGLSRRAIG